VACRLHVAGIAERQAIDTVQNPGTSLFVPESLKPSLELRRLPDLYHLIVYPMEYK
jgi:hypothetical protein